MRAILTFSLVAAILSYTMVSTPVAADEWNLVGTWVEPENPIPGQDTVVHVDLASVENVQWVRIIQCSLEPYVCFNPLYVDQPPGTHISELLREVDPGTPVGWNVTVQYANGTQEQSPVFGKAYAGQETISPIPEAIYFKYVMGGEPTDHRDGNTLLLVGVGAAAVAVLAVALILRRRQRREGRN